MGARLPFVPRAEIIASPTAPGIWPGPIALQPCYTDGATFTYSSYPLTQRRTIGIGTEQDRHPLAAPEQRGAGVGVMMADGASRKEGGRVMASFPFDEPVPLDGMV